MKQSRSSSQTQSSQPQPPSSFKSFFFSSSSPGNNVAAVSTGTGTNGSNNYSLFRKLSLFSNKFRSSSPASPVPIVVAPKTGTMSRSSTLIEGAITTTTTTTSMSLDLTSAHTINQEEHEDALSYASDSGGGKGGESGGGGAQEDLQEIELVHHHHHDQSVGKDQVLEEADNESIATRVEQQHRPLGIPRRVSNALHKASVAGNWEIARAIVVDGEKGKSEINVQDEYERTALHHASRSGSVEIVRLLIDHGADVNACDDSGFTALHFVGLNGNVEVARELIRGGANVHACDEEGWMAVHYAARNGYLALVQVLQ